MTANLPNEGIAKVVRVDEDTFEVVIGAETIHHFWRDITGGSECSTEDPEGDAKVTCEALNRAVSEAITAATAKAVEEATKEEKERADRNAKIYERVRAQYSLATTDLCDANLKIADLERQLSEALSKIESLEAEMGYHEAKDALEILKTQNEALVKELEDLRREIKVGAESSTPCAVLSEENKALRESSKALLEALEFLYNVTRQVYAPNGSDVDLARRSAEEAISEYRQKWGKA
jgi:hypothetical protein